MGILSSDDILLWGPVIQNIGTHNMYTPSHWGILRGISFCSSSSLPPSLASFSSSSYFFFDTDINIKTFLRLMFLQTHSLCLCVGITGVHCPTCLGSCSWDHYGTSSLYQALTHSCSFFQIPFLSCLVPHRHSPE